MMRSSKTLLSYWTILTILCICSSEYFTSLSHMKSLFELEQTLTSHLENVINKEEVKLKELKEFYHQIPKFKQHSDSQTYLGNPLHSYMLLKRFVGYWSKLEDLLSNNIERKFLSLLSSNVHMFPTEEDIYGARDALLRLQETFDISSQEMLQGFGSRFIHSSALGADDAFEIGLTAFDRQKNQLSRSWLDEALQLLDLGVYFHEKKPSRFEILDHLAWLEYLSEQYHAAYNHTVQMLIIEPSNKRIKENLKIYERTIKKEFKINDAILKEQQNIPIIKEVNEKKKKEKYKRFYHTKEEKAHDRYPIESRRMQELCRGETDPIPSEDITHLSCWYKTDNPLLVLKPGYVERLYVKPEILLFHNAMTDYEIRRVKILANPILERATVHNPKTGKLEFADYRTSKSAWLDESDDDLVASMNNRIEAYTGLDMYTAEKLQVANYGIGGHYETHFDFARTVPLRPPPWKNRTDYTYRYKGEPGEIIKENGNRIATMLFYMSDVERGGATVFTNIGQAVRPVKGDAVFWYNLHHDGSGDPDTRHAACPVLIGEKWVSNRWIHERGQEFRRKCNLTPEED